MKTIYILSFIFTLWTTCFVHLYCSDVTVYQYKIYCETEGTNVYVWSETEPTACPNDTSHTINANSISIIDEIGPSMVKVKEEATPTGGYYKTETIRIDALAGPDVTTSATRSWPYPISVLAVSFTTTADHVGDLVSLEAPSDKIFGYIAQDVSPTDTSISVSQTVIDNIAIGFHVKLFDGVTTNDLGRVTSVDSVNNEIGVETAATDSFLASSPTYVQVTVCQFKDFEIGPPWRYEVGLSKIGGSYFPANETAKLIYTNKGSTPKTLVVDYEYLY